MKKIYLLPCFLLSNIYAARISIINWNTFPVIISEETVPHNGQNMNLETTFNVEPGQTAQVQIIKNGTIYTNFNQITLAFNADGYTKKEILYFPDEESEEAYLSFSDSGYTRSPFNIITGK